MCSRTIYKRIKDILKIVYYEIKSILRSGALSGLTSDIPRFTLETCTKMKLKQVEQFLQQVEDFESPKIKYEQYATNAHLAGKLTALSLNKFLYSLM